MTHRHLGLTQSDLDAESVTALPDKQVLSLLNLNVDLDLMLDLAAPIDLAIAANANIAAPIDAAVSADVLAIDSTAQALGTQSATIDQAISGEALAEAPQTALVDQTGTADGGGASFAAFQPTGDTVTDTVDGVTDPVTDVVDGVTDPVTDVVDGVDGAVDGLGDTVDDVTQTVGDTLNEAISGLEAGALLQDGLLNVDVNANLDAALAAPVAGAVAANANVAAPIAAAVSANIGTIGSAATAVVDQTAVITQSMDDVVAEAVAAQDAEVIQ